MVQMLESLLERAKRGEVTEGVFVGLGPNDLRVQQATTVNYFTILGLIEHMKMDLYHTPFQVDVDVE